MSVFPGNTPEVVTNGYHGTEPFTTNLTTSFLSNFVASSIALLSSSSDFTIICFTLRRHVWIFALRWWKPRLITDIPSFYSLRSISFFFFSSFLQSAARIAITVKLRVSLSHFLRLSRCPGFLKKRTLLPLLPLNLCTEWIKGRNPSSPPLFPLPQPISLRARIIYVGFDSCIWIHWLCIAILITPFFSSLFLLRSRRYSVFNVLAPIDESSMLTRSFVL